MFFVTLITYMMQVCPTFAFDAEIPHVSSLSLNFSKLKFPTSKYYSIAL